ncbi:MAG: hypothetical protein HOC74_36190, partial [Gemmatimonadetes bacterium]|nr:hypothetical protein [Gemmatimonadota bacterium]
MRIAIAGFAHESNTFASQPTRLEDFSIYEGEEIVPQYGNTFHEVAGYIAGAKEFGFELYPIIEAGATPSGTVTREAYEEVTGRILQGLKNGPQLDGLLLALHGAMVSEDFPQADGET